MRINGVWIGWGLGDHSRVDLTVQRAKAYMRAMFRSYAGHLADTNVYDSEMETAVIEMQRRLVERPLNEHHLIPGQFYIGVLDLPTQTAMGFKKLPPLAPDVPARPIGFTVEGHLSNMFVGPTAVVASTLEAEGRCHWKPTGYDNVSLPFNNRSGWEQLFRTLSGDKVEGPLGADGKHIMWPFPPGTPWFLLSFSQGSIVACEFMLRYVLPTNAPLHYRLKDFRRGIAFGSPYRELDQVAPWVPDPPRAGTQGISDRRFNTTEYVLPDGRLLRNLWQEHSRTGDLYAENETNEVGLNKTAIYKMVQAEFTGNNASILARLWDLALDPIPGAIDIFRSIVSGVLFLGDMTPHGGYDLGPAINWVRDGLAS